MTFLGRLLGYLSLLANLALALFLLGIGAVGAAEGAEVKMDVIPADPESMTQVVLFAGLGGLFAVLLAFKRGRFSRSLLVLWSLLVAGILLYAFFRPGYRFGGQDDFQFSVWVFLASLVALLGSFLHWRLSPRRRPRY